MYECHGMKGLAVGTDRGFRYTPTIDLDHLRLATHVALEESYHMIEGDGMVLYYRKVSNLLSFRG